MQAFTYASQNMIRGLILKLDVLMSIQKQLDAYNRKGEVYSDVLFHDCINIGKANPKSRDQYAQFVPRTPTGKRVPLWKINQ